MTGGVRSGKSTFAEGLLCGAAAVDYVATSARDHTDPEWEARVALHRERRPGHWRTIETLDVAGVLARDEPAAVLVDCLGTWLARVMDESGSWEDAPGAAEGLAGRVEGLLDALATTRRRVVLVTNEVGLGVVPETPSGRLFRDELGRLNARAAALCDDAWLCVVGLPVRLKG